MSAAEILGAMRRFRAAKVLVVGDLMLDEFVWGRVERISPEGPVPVVHVEREEHRLGAAANVAHNIRALGGRVLICGALGDDAAGHRLVGALRTARIDAKGVFLSRSESTIRKTRVIAHQQQVTRLDRENEHHGRSRAALQARAYALARLWQTDAVVLSDYGKGMITEGFLTAIAAARARRPFRLIIDPKRSNFPFYRGASLLTPNREEASQAAGVDIRDHESLLTAGATLLTRWQAEAVLITRGEEGMTLFRRGRPPRHFSTMARQVFDVTGAGDTVVAACALALAAGTSLETAAVLANHAAGIVVGQVGTAVVTADQLRSSVRDVDRATPRRAVAPVEHSWKNIAARTLQRRRPRARRT